jgi:hypothetical protein
MEKGDLDETTVHKTERKSDSNAAAYLLSPDRQILVPSLNDTPTDLSDNWNANPYLSL